MLHTDQAMRVRERKKAVHTQDVMNHNRIIFPNALLSFLVLDPSVVVTAGAFGVLQNCAETSPQRLVQLVQ